MAAGALLPGGLGNAGDQAVGGQLTEGDTGEFEAADVRAAATGDEAAVGETDGARIAGKLAEAHIVLLRLELCTEFRPLRDGLALAFVSFKP